MVCGMRFNSQHLLKSHGESHEPPPRKRRSKGKVAVKEKKEDILREKKEDILIEKEEDIMGEKGQEIAPRLNTFDGPVTRGRSSRATKVISVLPRKTRGTASPKKSADVLNTPESNTPTLGIQSSEIDQQEENGEPEKATKRKLKKPKDLGETTPKKKRKYKCKICPAEFTSTLYFSQHLESHDKYYSVVALENVTTISQSGKPFQCKFCGEEFESDDEAYNHMKDVHLQTLPYQCRICDSKLASRTSMRYHLLSHSGNKSYQCHVCSRTYGYLGALNRHLKIHKSKDILCQLCGKLFSTKSSLGQHHIRVHSKTLVKSHACEVCGKRFDRLSKLSLHRTIHSKDKNLLCDICGKTFKHEWLLKNHSKLNCGDKVEKELKRVCKPTTPAKTAKCPRPHKCTACNRRYATVEQLSDHVTLSHEKECILCGVAIYSGAALRAHRAVCKFGQIKPGNENCPKEDNTKQSPLETKESIEAPVDGESKAVNSEQPEGVSSPPLETQESDLSRGTTNGDVELSYAQENKSRDQRDKFLPAESTPKIALMQSPSATDSAVESILYTLSEGAKPTPTDDHVLHSAVEDPACSSAGQSYSQSQGGLSGSSVPAPLTIDPAMVETLTAAGVTGSQIRMEDGTIVLLLDEHSMPAPSQAAGGFAIIEADGVSETVLNQ